MPRTSPTPRDSLKALMFDKRTESRPFPEEIRFLPKTRVESRGADEIPSDSHKHTRRMIASKPIPTQRDTRKSPDTTRDTSSPYDDASMELATWRLYHRIVEHREKHPILCKNMQGKPSPLKTCKFVPSQSLPIHNIVDDEDRYEMEVFEMDL